MNLYFGEKFHEGVMVIDYLGTPWKGLLMACTRWRSRPVVLLGKTNQFLIGHFYTTQALFGKPQMKLTVFQRFYSQWTALNISLEWGWRDNAENKYQWHFDSFCARLWFADTLFRSMVTGRSFLKGGDPAGHATQHRAAAFRKKAYSIPDLRAIKAFRNNDYRR